MNHLSNASIVDTYPLSPMQQGMLFHSLSGVNGVDIEQVLFTLHEEIEIGAFEKAWNLVATRHAALRTSFRWEKLAEPVQDVHSEITLPFSQVDWRSLSEADQRTALGKYLEVDRQSGFDLSKAPNSRIMVARVGKQTHKCIWTVHHILLDGRAFPIVLNEVFAIYHSLIDGIALSLPQTSAYRDHIDWLQKKDWSESEAFWRNRLKGFTFKSVIKAAPSSDLRPSTAGRKEVCIPLSDGFTSALKGFASEHDVTPNTVIQAAWAVLLSRYCGEEDIVFGATRACRRSTVDSAGHIVGIFINTLPMRVCVSAELPILQLLHELRKQQLEIRSHEQTPLVTVKGWSDLKGDSPLFESFINIDRQSLDATMRQSNANGIARDFEVMGAVSYPIMLRGYLEPELRLDINFDTAVVDAGQISQMAGSLKVIMEGILRAPSSTVATLPYLSSIEEDKLLVQWNRTTAQYPKHLCLHHLFESQVARVPDAIAAVYDQQSVSYTELNRRANHLALQLRAAGVGAESIVGLCVERSLDLVVGVLGILKAGGAYLPLDIAYPRDRLAFMLDDTKAPVVLTQRALVPQLPPHRAKLVCIDEMSAEGPVQEVISDSTPSNLAYVIYTSGSTGKPKGVLLEHRNVVNLITSILREPGFSETDVMLSVTTLSFDIATAELFLPLCSGGQLVIASREVAADGLKLRALLEASDATFLQPTPVTWQMLLDAGWAGSPRLKMISTGEPLPRELAGRLLGKGASLWNLYGPTETTIWSTGCRIDGIDESISIGRPVENTQVYILDTLHQPVPIGVPGELYLGGDGLARGYLNRPDLTAERFVPNPFVAIDGSPRLYRTGDLARYRSDGMIECLGRIDHQVKLRGFRIELGEIEAVLDSHPAISKSAVMVREDTPGNKRLVAYCVPAFGQNADPLELRKHAKASLPEYMAPSAFVIMAEFPMTPNRKIDRKALPAPDSDRPSRQTNYAPPRNETEAAVCGIWREVLGVKTVSREDDFFDLGGHSLSAMRVRSRIADTLGVTLAIRTIFEDRTASLLANRIDAMRWAIHGEASKPALDRPGNEEIDEI